MRTTIDIDDPILREVKKLQKIEGKSLGQLVSDLLARALRERKPARQKPKPTCWISKSMGARIDLGDKEALYAAMERQTHAGKRTDTP
ncbi:MAG: antitoxin [Nitrospirota bacterium]|nr:antitoxin [Nitrospirota bacterium]